MGTREHLWLGVRYTLNQSFPKYSMNPGVLICPRKLGYFAYYIPLLGDSDATYMLEVLRNVATYIKILKFKSQHCK